MWRQFAEIKVEKIPDQLFSYDSFCVFPLDGFLITLYHPLMISNAPVNSWVAQQLILTQLTPVWKYTIRYEIQDLLKKKVFISRN